MCLRLAGEGGKGKSSPRRALISEMSRRQWGLSSAQLIRCGLPGTSPQQSALLRLTRWKMQPFLRTGDVKAASGDRGSINGKTSAQSFVWVLAGDEVSPSVAQRMAGLGRVSGQGTRAGTRWTVCGHRPQTEQSGLLVCGQRRARQPDVESVGWTLRSVGCLGCGGGRQPGVLRECAVRGARRSAWARL